MTESDAPNAGSVRPRRSSNRNAKLVLLVAVLAVCGVFYVMSIREPAMPEGFTTDLKAARKEARKNFRPILVLFWTPRVDTTATRHLLGEKGLPHQSVVDAIRKGKYICVAVKLDRDIESDPVAREYKIARVPTLVVLSDMGAERKRIEGGTGHDAIERMLVETVTTRP